ncbi:hypothetical protein ABZ876_31275 [Streptomyces sp. NPDC046931]|uniref:hypothetical protein n=1 Tax=Streptomyces sp. NPDC046931 TaxID=3154806 RepID=UPI0033D7C2AA
MDPGSPAAPCTPKQCRRWCKAADAYAAALDGISIELMAAQERANRWWMLLIRPWAKKALRKIRLRYPEVVREACEAYEPVRLEIQWALQAEEDNDAARARLAAREIWGRATAQGADGAPLTFVFRDDVPPRDVPESATVEGSFVDVRRLRLVLADLGRPCVVWDRAALAKTEEELAGLTFWRWWLDQFSEDYDAYSVGRRARPTRSGSSAQVNRGPGGTAAGGTGGFTGLSIH